MKQQRMVCHVCGNRITRKVSYRRYLDERKVWRFRHRECVPDPAKVWRWVRDRREGA